MKRTATLVLSAVLSLGLLAGCGGNTTPSAAPSTSAESAAPAALAGTVNTDGSTSMEKVVKALAEAYMGENKDVTVNYSGTGSGSGIEAVVSGTCDIGLSSRELKDEEVSKGAVSHVVALDGIAVIVNSSNPIKELTVEQIAKIATGEVKNWSELGGSDSPIAFFGREAGSGTRGAFEEIVKVTDKCVYTNEYSSTGDVMGNVASNPNAIGYASLSAVNDTVSAVKVNGIECSEVTVKDGTYPIQRPFLLVTKEGTELSEAAQSFLDFCMSAEVAEYITVAGAVAP